MATRASALPKSRMFNASRRFTSAAFCPTSRLSRGLAALLLFLGLTPAAQAVPLAPSAMRGVVTSTGAITLLWDDNSTDETEFQITYTANGGAAQLLTVPSTTTATKGLTGAAYNVGAASFTFERWPKSSRV